MFRIRNRNTLPTQACRVSSQQLPRKDAPRRGTALLLAPMGTTAHIGQQVGPYLVSKLAYGLGKTVAIKYLPFLKYLRLF